MEGWEILNTYLKQDYPCMDSRNYFEHLLIYIYNKVCNGMY